MPQILTHTITAAPGADGANGFDGQGFPGGRLTLATGDPLPTTDQLAKTTVYYTPYIHAFVNLYDGANWTTNLVSGEKSVAVPSTTNTPFDVFGFLSAGDLALETLNWTNDTTRATGLARQDGFWVKSGDASRLYLGTGRTTGSSGQCEDSAARRLLWNALNHKERKVSKVITATGYTYNTASMRSVNADTTFRHDAICGLVGSSWMELNMLIFCTSTVATFVASSGIGVGSTTVNSAKTPTFEVGIANAGMMMQARLQDYMPLGYQFYQALERGGGGAGTYTWFNGADRGIYGWIVA